MSRSSGNASDLDAFVYLWAGYMSGLMAPLHGNARENAGS